MTRCVALLGGINVGGHRVRMDHLRRLFEQLGFHDVHTFIASGNVVFRPEEIDERRIRELVERHLEAELGYRVPVFLRTVEELTAIAAAWPFSDPPPEPHTLSVLFLDEPLSESSVNVLHDYRTPVDAFRVIGREIFWLCRTKTSESPVNWTQLGKSAVLPRRTVRNATTVRKLVAKFSEMK